MSPIHECIRGRASRGIFSIIYGTKVAQGQIQVLRIRCGQWWHKDLVKSTLSTPAFHTAMEDIGSW